MSSMIRKMMVGLAAVAIAIVDECIRSTKKDHSSNTKAVVRDVDRGHSELGTANRATVWTSWWTSWKSHRQTAPDDSKEVASARSPILPLPACILKSVISFGSLGIPP